MNSNSDSNWIINSLTKGRTAHFWAQVLRRITVSEKKPQAGLRRLLYGANAGQPIRSLQ